MKTLTARCELSLPTGLALVAITLILAGCMSTRTAERYITSFPDPDFLRKRYNLLVVHFDTTDLVERKFVESFLVHELRRKHVNPYESSGIFPPTRSWDSVSTYAGLISANVDGYLRITESKRWIDSVWIPLKHVTKTTREKNHPKNARSGCRNRSYHNYKYRRLLDEVSLASIQNCID